MSDFVSDALPPKKRRKRMNRRTEGEINAYVEGYTKCYNDFTEYLKGREGVEYTIRKMNMLLAAVKAVVEQEDNDNQVG